MEIIRLKTKVCSPFFFTSINLKLSVFSMFWARLFASHALKKQVFNKFFFLSDRWKPL